MTQLDEYKKETFQALVVRSSKKIDEHNPAYKVFHFDKLALWCKHAVNNWSTQVDQSRPNQHSYFTDCQFKLYLKFNYKLEYLEFGKF